MGQLAQLAEMTEAALEPARILKFGGVVSAISQGAVSVRGIATRVGVGDLVEMREGALAEVIRVDDAGTVVCPFDDDLSVRVGDIVTTCEGRSRQPNEFWLGRIVNAVGETIDDIAACRVPATIKFDVGVEDKNVLGRDRVSEPLKTGVAAIDIFTPICAGQRIGVFAGSGVGKSTLLSMLARSHSFDVVVVALVGERGREVREFVEDTLGPEGMKKTVAVVATGDESPMLRRRAPELALQSAEFFSRRGNKVLLLVDSLTRYAHALREIGIAAGELPIARGYPASVFSKLPKLLERAGPGRGAVGSITAIATILVDGDDHNDPIADAVRGIADGHIVLDRSIAEQGRFPPINPLSSVSRLALKVWSKDEHDLVRQMSKLIAKYEETADLRMLGGWQKGADADLDKAVETVPVIYDALRQSANEPLLDDSFGHLVGRLKQHQLGGEPPQVGEGSTMQ